MIISIVNQKGGTAKTTTTLNLGSGLARLGKKVLLVDWDAQGNLSYALGFQQPSPTISDVLHDDASLRESILHHEDGIDLIPSGISLADTEFSMAEADDRTSFLQSILDTVKKDYHFILIDCPPSLSLLTLNALRASQGVIIPMQADVLSLQGLELILQTIEKVKKNYNQDLTILGILPVMVDFRRKLTQEVLEHIKMEYEVPIFQSFIRNNVRASEAPSFGKSVIEYAPRSNSAIDYLNFSKEIKKHYS
jgi:chromosome partitioning protein